MKTCLIFFGVFLFIFAATALSAPDSTEIGRSLTMLIDKVGLSDEQAEQIRAVLMSQFEKTREDRGREWKDDEAPILAARHRMHFTDSVIESALTEEQLPLYRQFMRDRREHALGKEVLALAGYLNLTDEQATRLGAIIFDFDQDKPQNKGEEKPLAVDPVKMREQAKTSMDDLDTQIEMILTPQQKYKYEQYKEEKKERPQDPRPREGMKP